jgi:hypothetical protein
MRNLPRAFSSVASASATPRKERLDAEEARHHRSDTVTTGELSPKNGRLTVPSLTADPATLLDDALCPNPNWDPRIREGTLTLTNFTYTLRFEGFAGAFLTITGP